MLKKRIKYTDYNGVEKEKDFFFNLKKSELVDLAYKTPGGFINYINKITEANDESALWKAFRDVVVMSYGEKSDDGERFIKTPELAAAFEQTEAFSELIMELIEQDGAAESFINSVMPKDISEQAKNQNHPALNQ